MSPSTDDLPGKKPPERRTRQGGMKRKPGKQPGAPGAFLAWNEHPDKTEDVFPEGICPCGADLADSRDLGVKYSHQVTDLPEARAVTIQHDRHEMQCACGRAHIADAPPGAAGAPGTVTYGLNFHAWCVFLLVVHHVPVERCADILESMSVTDLGMPSATEAISMPDGSPGIQAQVGPDCAGAGWRSRSRPGL